MPAFIRIWFFALLCFLSVMQASYALPFSVVPKAGTKFPTRIITNSTVTVYYTVTNNTRSQMKDTYVKYLPPNTRQVTSGGAYSDTCGATFNLAPRGSCTLQLSVSGIVNGNDPNPHHHLFICTNDGITCAGTSYPLNIQQAVANIGAYVTEFNKNRVSYCVVKSDGSFGSCRSTGGFNEPIGGAINPANHFLYILNWGNQTISYCTIQANGSLTHCRIAVSGMVAQSLTFNAAGTFAYIPDASSKVFQCRVDNDGRLSSCTATGGNFYNPVSFAFNPQETFAYVGSFANPGLIASVCVVSSNGTLSSCHDTGAVATSLFYPLGIAVNAQNTFFYALDSNGNNLTSCGISSGGDLSACAVLVGGLNHPQGIALNNTNTFLYITSPEANNIYSCPLRADGSLGSCLITGTTLTTPTSVILG